MVRKDYLPPGETEKPAAARPYFDAVRLDDTFAAAVAPVHALIVRLCDSRWNMSSKDLEGTAAP